MGVIKKQTIQNTIYSYLGVLIGTFTQAYLVPNHFTTEQNGLLQLLLSYMFIIAQISSLGFNSAGNKYFTFFRNEKNAHNGYLALGLLFSLIGGILCYFLVHFLKNELIFTQDSDNGLLEKYFWVVIPISVATILFNLFDNFLKSNYKTVFGTFLNQFLQRFFVLISVLCLIVGLVNFEHFINLWIIAIVLPTILIFYQVLKTPGGAFHYNSFFFGWEKKRSFIVFSSISTLTGISTLIIAHLDKILIFKYLGLSMTGIYGTISLFGSVMGMSYLAVVKASTAIVVDSINTNDIGKLHQIYIKSSITQFAFGGLILLGVYYTQNELFSFIKPAYAIGKTALIIIGIAKLLDLSNGINGLILSNSKNYKIDTILIITFVGFLALLNGILIPSYGITGAALAVLISMMYYNVLRTYFVYKTFGILPFTRKHIWLLGVLVVFLLLGFFIFKDMTLFNNAILSITVKSIIISVIYLFLVVKIGVYLELNDFIGSLNKKFISKK